MGLYYIGHLLWTHYVACAEEDATVLVDVVQKTQAELYLKIAFANGHFVAEAC
jgi:hypothetical protein